MTDERRVLSVEQYLETLRNIAMLSISSPDGRGKDLDNAITHDARLRELLKEALGRWEASQFVFDTRQEARHWELQRIAAIRTELEGGEG